VAGAATVTAPLTGWVPLQAPEAVQLVTPVELQLRPKLPPGATVEGTGGWKLTDTPGPPLEEELLELPEELLPELEPPEELAPEEELPPEVPAPLLPPEPLSLWLQPASRAPAPSMDRHRQVRSRFMLVPRFIVNLPDAVSIAGGASRLV
jgi:hypothetical protein